MRIIALQRFGPRQKQLALGLVVRSVGRAQELGPRLGVAPEALEQVAADGRQQVVVAQRGLSASASTSSSPASGPKAIATATARLSSTTGEPVSAASPS